MRHTVKICGLTRPEDVENAIGYGASYLGFIIEARSPRRLSAAQAAALAGPAKGIAARVAVTVNADDDLIDTIMHAVAPDYIQCHGDESPERVAHIRRAFGVKTIKAIAIETRSDMITAQQYAGTVDFMLFDAKPPKGEQIRGGHGISFDWRILNNAPLPKNWALAGGLTPLTARLAIAATNAPIVDVSSGVEHTPGIKDHQKIKDFMKAVQDNG